MVTGQQVAEWLSRLVQIPSVSPDQAGPRAGEPGEARLASSVAHWFRALGGEVFCEDVLPGRPNVYGLWRGQADRWLAVDVHLDTVSVEQMIGDPFDGRLADGRVYGRGAVDTKASLAVVLALLEHLQQHGQQPATNLLIAATVDEEVGATGAPACAAWLQRQGLSIAQLIVAEPTLCVPIHGHKGVARAELRVQGQAAHSSQPHLGQNAILAAAELALALQHEHERLQTLPPSPLGNAMLTVTMLHGGSGINVVPVTCQLFFDRRVVTGEDARGVNDALLALAQQACPLPVTIHRQKEINAFYQPADAPLVRQLATWSGHAAEVAPYGTNAFAYPGLVHEVVVFGPGSIAQAHGAVEWVAVDELATAASLYARWWGLT